MAFCTKCGHSNLEGARFCEDCGHPFGATTAPMAPKAPIAPIAPVIQPPAANFNKPGKGRIAVLIGAVLSAILIVGGLAFVLMPESASNSTFAKAIAFTIEKQPELLSKHYCLDNFVYDKDPVYTNYYDSNLKNWMQFLVEAGLYTEPEVVVDGGGYFAQRLYKYSKTPTAARFIRDKKLCFADGVVLKSVDSFTPPRKLGDIDVSVATVTLALSNPAAWSQTEQARDIEAAFKPETTAEFVLVLHDGKWEVANEKLENFKNKSKQEPSTSDNKPEKQGFFERLFSFGQANPILGTWATSAVGITIATFEFRSDSMVSNGIGVKVTYKIEDNQVTVYEKDKSAGLVIRVVDKDNLVISEGFAQVKMVRVK